MLPASLYLAILNKANLFLEVFFEVFKEVEEVQFNGQEFFLDRGENVRTVCKEAVLVGDFDRDYFLLILKLYSGESF